MKNSAIQRIQKMNAYLPPPPGRGAYGMLLDFNERTTRPSRRVGAALRKAFSDGRLEQYPEYDALEQAISSYVGLNSDAICATNGSDQAISLIFRLFTDAGDTVVIPTPSFAMFYQAAAIIGNNVVTPMYRNPDMSFPFAQVMNRMTDDVRLVVLCTPNNPTGTIIPKSEIRSIAQKAGNAVVLIDEAYAEFSGESSIDLIRQFPNIIVTRTLSKAFGIAGARLGYAVGDPLYVAQLKKIRGPYDVNAFAATAGIAALSDLPDMKSYVSRVMNISKPMLEDYFQKNRVPFFPSRANFLLIRPDNAMEAEQILRKNGVLVRPQDKPGIEGTLRVTIGTPKQTRQFIRIYSRYVLSKPNRTKYAFIDRDGTLIYEPQDTFQVDSVYQLRILPGAVETLQKLVQSGYTLVMVTNQDGLGTPANPLPAFRLVQRELLRRLKQNGITFERICICPHLPEADCACRKPKTGLLAPLLNKQGMDRTGSFVLGDRDSDRQLAENLGVLYVPMQTNGNVAEAFKKASFRKERI